MNTEEYKGELDAAIQAELQADTEFQTAYAALATDDEKTAALETKRASILAKKAPEFFAEFKKASKIAEDQKIRAEKAEKGEKPPKKEEGDTKEDNLSTTDLYALMNAKVPEEDVPDVKEAAKLLKVTIAEVLKNPIVIAQLKQKADFRTTANANNTDPKRPSNKTITDAELLDRASKGETFAKGSPEAEQLFWARRGGKKS